MADHKTGKLKKGLGLAEVFCIATGAMISSGLFILPGLAYARAGPAVIVAYVLAGLLATTGLLSIAELSTAMPKAGGDYFFITRAMGPAVGTVAGLLNWFSLSLKSAFALVGMAAFARLMIDVDMRIMGILLTGVFVAINLVGAKETARLQVALVAGLLVLMCLYLIKGFPAVDVQRFAPFVKDGQEGMPAMRTVVLTAGFVFVSYGGLLKIASVSEEIRNPGRTIPLGMILSVIIATAFYAFMVLVTCGVLDGKDLASSMTPISDGAAKFMGQKGRTLMTIGAMLAFISTANAGIMAASRYLLALGRDGMLPEPLSRISPKRRVPALAIMATGLLVMLALFLDLELLVKAASTVLILSHILSNLSIIVLRESGVQNYRPLFRAPLYPWVQIVGILGLSFIAFEMGETAFLISALLITIGFGAYWFFGRARVARDSALLHLIEKFTASELVTGSLERELRDIIHERDEIVKDRFDRLVENCEVIDLPDEADVEGLFEAVAERLSPKMGIDENEFVRLLHEREEQSATALSPGLAVPHVVIEGEGKFEILLARSKKGVDFSGDAPHVHATFILIGTRDERTFHLRALAAIAQIAQDPRFENRWLAARDAQALRDVVLLGQRRRVGE
jgi:basic amino acid/polyamine antiporter, APA family